MALKTLRSSHKNVIFALKTSQGQTSHIYRRGRVKTASFKSEHEKTQKNRCLTAAKVAAVWQRSSLPRPPLPIKWQRFGSGFGSGLRCPKNAVLPLRRKSQRSWERFEVKIDLYKHLQANSKANKHAK